MKPGSSKSAATYIFGYGSLVSNDQLTTAFGRNVNIIYPVRLKGWVREWGVKIANLPDVGHYQSIADSSVPPHVAVLNVRKPKHDEAPTDPNGVLFEVSDQELEILRQREIHYDLVDITNEIPHPVDGKVYMWTAKPEYICDDIEDSNIVIPSSYFELVRQAFRELDKSSKTNEYDIYLATTVEPQFLRVLPMQRAPIDFI